MKRKNNFIRILCLLMVLAICATSMTSCLLWLSGGADEDYMTEDEVRDLLAGTMGGDVNIGEVNEYDVTINNEGRPNLAAATKGLLSTVSIKCSFKVRVGYTNNTVTESSAGAGVIYKLNKTSGDAYIITNYHVIYDPKSSSENGG